MTPEYPKSDLWVHPSDPSVALKFKVTSIRLYGAGDISEKSSSHRKHSCKLRFEEFCQTEIQRETDSFGPIGVRPGSDTKIYQTDS